MTNHIHGGDIYRNKNMIDFSANCNPFGTPPGVIRAICAAAEEIRNYPDVECEELRNAVGAHENQDPDTVICGNGAADVIFSLVYGAGPKKALLPAPTFAEYEQALRAAGCEVEYYYMNEERGFCLEEDFIGRIRPDTDMVFLCNPNNPTGVLTGRDFLQKTLKRCEEMNVRLVIDECFLDFVENPADYTMKGMLKEHPTLFILKAFTKLYAMAGIRLGYGLSADRGLMEKISRVRQPWSVSHLAQKAGAAALLEKEFVEKSLTAIRTERQFLLDGLNRLGFETGASAANYIFFKGPEDLRERLMKEGILIRDCGNYEGLSRGYYRAAVRLREENEALLTALAKIKEEVKWQKR